MGFHTPTSIKLSTIKPVLTFKEKWFTRTGIYGRWLLFWADRVDGKLMVCLWHPELQLRDCYSLGGISPNQGNIDYEITRRLKDKEFHFDSVHTQ